MSEGKKAGLKLHQLGGLKKGVEHDLQVIG